MKANLLILLFVLYFYSPDEEFDDHDWLKQSWEFETEQVWDELLEEYPEEEEISEEEDEH
jgi:hypothetical protein